MSLYNRVSNAEYYHRQIHVYETDRNSGTKISVYNGNSCDQISAWQSQPVYHDDNIDASLAFN